MVASGSLTKRARVPLSVILLAFVVLACTSVFAQVIQIPTQELVFAHVAVGGGWETEITLVAQGADRSYGEIKLLDRIGSGMFVSVNDGPEVTSWEYSLPARSSKTFRLTSNGPSNRGWAVVSSQVPGNTDHGSITGLLTYRYRVANVVSSQVGILPSEAVTRAHIPFDETNNNMTAIAVATLNWMNLDVEPYRADGTPLQEKTTINFMPNTQQALYVHELFPAAMNTRGFLILKATAPFNMAALNVNQDNWSGLAGLPGVFERDLTLSVGAVSKYRVRLIQNGTFLNGIAEMVSPQQGTMDPISGAIVSTTQRQVLQLNLHTTSAGKGMNITLIAPVNDSGLVNVSGRALAVTEDGNTAGSGTFSMSTPSTAQF